MEIQIGVNWYSIPFPNPKSLLVDGKMLKVYQPRANWQISAYFVHVFEGIEISIIWIQNKKSSLL